MKKVAAGSPYDEALTLMQSSRPDSNRAKLLLEKAMSLGDHRATYALATWYLFGEPPAIEINYKTAAKLLKTAADAGIPEAQFDYGVTLEKGAGVKKNENLALTYYLRAALAGDPGSMEAVGRMYYHGLGVAKDRRVAWIWLDKARSSERSGKAPAKTSRR